MTAIFPAQRPDWLSALLNHSIIPGTLKLFGVQWRLYERFALDIRSHGVVPIGSGKDVLRELCEDVQRLALGF